MTPADRSQARFPHRFKRHDNLLVANGGNTDRDDWSVSEVLDLFPSLPTWPATDGAGRRSRLVNKARRILEWLSAQPGQGWQDRWLASGADEGRDWVNELVVPGARATARTQRQELVSGMGSLLLCRIVMPSYHFLAKYQAARLFSYTQQVFCPDLFAKLHTHGLELDTRGRQLRNALTTISKIVVHTGRDVDHLTADDLLTYRAWRMRRLGHLDDGVILAWILMRSVVDLGEHLTIRDAARHGQRPTAELVDVYQPQCEPIRDVLIRYLDERRPSLDYSSFTGLVGVLVGRFWTDIEHHKPGIDTLHLPEDVASAWKQRLRTIRNKDGTTRPRKDYLQILIRVRGFYLDLQEWAQEDPSWVQWSVPSPVRKGETAGQMKLKKKTTAEMHQRTRDRLPRLPTLVDTAERHKAEQAALLAAASAALVGQTVHHGGREYQRILPTCYSEPRYQYVTQPVLIQDAATGEETDVTKSENEAFNAWAVIEVLRHTGVRIEELMEITHLGLVSYTLPDTGEVVPMLQVVPSKAHEERLLLVGPELASVLATVITRMRSENGGSVPLTARYDGHERVMGPPLPHLFQHRHGAQWTVLNPTTIKKLLTQTLVLSGLCDAAGQPLHYTPHDFRRMFATEAVTGGLPVHIVARILGHANINTTQAYAAVFDEHLVRVYRSFLDRRRTLRPEAEYREPTEEEWREFQQHFHARTLELGECGRAYGTSCKHEHACIRCPSLRLDPKSRPRLFEIIANLKDRIQEAKLNAWLGEVDGLESSLKAATRKLVSLDRMRDRQPTGSVNLGIPVIVDPPR
ncbi:MAG: tyrosine-type recombinase/integrase [Pseudonocardiaceae bacterium]